MKAGTTYSKKQYNTYSKLYSITGIAFIIIGILSTIPLPPFGIVVILVGILLLRMSKNFAFSAKEGGHSENIENFLATNEVKGYIKFNNDTKQLLVNPKRNPRIFNYSDIIDFELVENDKTIVNKGGLGRAMVGGGLFGGVGAVVGGVTGKSKTERTVSSLKIKLIVRDMNNPNIYINLLASPTKSTSLIYKTAYEVSQRILSMLQIALT